ncbi:deoxyribose-phosphate aldolase [Methylobacterium platani]|uniref:Deoxyribose-phosphate aldolase n=2 Tax=Methylobacterium platani TaxID=427683 RepID=A0A179SGE5_9HYPH|nr:deoxyribose-phosphate aldolase [Methylobacterium platani]KMO16730.1 deoxyribose-phosphate aldolase [Methylobacterium platani JCM 14648]OAS26057.1 2-deoxyribose-5-phosphate aldolase [Methylobacterium platani]
MDASAPAGLAGLIDHTLLRADATGAEVRRLCEEALAHRLKAVCVNPVHVGPVAEILAGSGVAPCSVVGFPLGASMPADKAAEAAGAVARGAAEIDMVIALGALKDGRHDAVRADIAAVRAACRGRVLKVIVETCLLDEAQKRLACLLAAEAGADFVKTSTGFSTGGATVADVALMRATVGDALGVKASGGVRSLEVARALVEAGATRLGTSSGVALVTAGVAGGSY